MKNKFKKLMTVGVALLLIIAVKVVQNDKRVFDVALCNIEALAGGSEFKDGLRCFGVGSLDCPANNSKVYAISSPFSLNY